MQPVEQTRARPGVVALAAVLVEIVIIAAVCNQGLSDNVASFSSDHENDFIGQVARSTRVYDWRLSSQAGAAGHLLVSQYAMLATLFVLTAVFAAVLARGAVTFGRVFLGIWLGVIVATNLAVIVQALVLKVDRHGVDRFTYAVFGGPSSYHFFAGIWLGLFTALVAALVAVANSRRPAPRTAEDDVFDDYATREYPRYVPPAARPASPSGSLPPAPAPPWASAPPAQSSGPPPAQSSGSPAAHSSAPPPRPSAPAPPAPTQQVSPPPSEPDQASDQTTRLPRVPPPAPAPADDPNKTTQLRTFPRPPDDEDLGHHPE